MVAQAPVSYTHLDVYKRQDIYRLLNNHVLSRIFHFKKIEDVNYCCGGMIQFTFMLVLALFFLVAGG